MYLDLACPPRCFQLTSPLNEPLSKAMVTMAPHRTQGTLFPYFPFTAQRFPPYNVGGSRLLKGKKT